MIEGHVPNISHLSNRQISTYNHIRHGRKCVIPQPGRSARAHVKTLFNNSFTVRAVKLFNVIPKHIRNITGCGVEKFKEKLDVYLRSIPDEPALPGYPTVLESNSLLDVIPHQEWRRF